MEIESIQPSKKAKLFCARTFREDLKGSDALKSLKKFISLEHNDEDIILEYMENGGSLQEILAVIDTTARGDLTTALPVFEVVHLILLRFQPPNSKYHHHCIQSVKHILNTHLLTIQSLLSMNISKHKKVALKLLTAIVTLNSSFAFEVLNLFSPTSTIVADLIAPAAEKESVRKYFILFILSFLIDGNPAIIKVLMENKGYLSMIIPGLKYDEASTVSAALSLMENKILKNAKILKTLKLKTFNTHIVKALFELFDWKGPQMVKKHQPGKKKKHKIVEVDQEDRALVIESLHSFLLVLCTSKKFGVSFSDKSSRISDYTCNQLLLSVFEGLSDPMGCSQISDIILKTLISCPDLVQPTLHKLEPFFQPRSSSNWKEAMQFAEKLLEELDVVNLVNPEKESSGFEQYAIKITKAFCMPSSFLRTVKAGAQASQPMDVKLASLQLMNIMWNSVQKIVVAYPNVESSLKKAIDHSIFKSLPEFDDLIDLWHQVCNENLSHSHSSNDIFSNLKIIIKSLSLFIELSSRMKTSLLGLASELFNSTDKIKNNLQRKEYLSIRAYILKFVEMDLNSLTPDKELFKTALLISLQSAEEPNALSCAFCILSNLEVFERNKPEVYVWLSSFMSFSADERLLLSTCLVESIQTMVPNSKKDEPDVGKIMSAFIFHCIKRLDLLDSTSEEELNKKNIFKTYLQDVAIHLQHLYADTGILYESLKEVKKTLGKSVFSYLKCWTTNSFLNVSSIREYLCPYEAELESWLLKENDKRDIKDVVTSKLEIHKRFRLFGLAVGHLIVKIINGDFSESESEKFLKAFLFFIKECTFPIREESSVVCSLSNEAIFRQTCVEQILQNKIFLKNFNIFCKKKCESVYLSSIVVKILMESKHLTESQGVKNLLINWKAKFLKSVEKKFQQQKSIESVENFDFLLDFFDYQHKEINDMVDMLTQDSDFGLFVKSVKPSKWMRILVKFVKLYSVVEEVSKPFLNKLCTLANHLHNGKCADLKILYDCFIVIIKEHPQCLTSFENEFFNIILSEVNVETSTVILGKLLLNDPKKVQHFLGGEFERAQFELLFPLVSALLIDEDPFYEAIKSKNICSVWKPSDISAEISPILFQCLEKIYNRFRSEIIKTLKGELQTVYSQNLLLFRCLIKLFIDKDIFKLMKKDIRRGCFEPILLFEAVKKFKVDKITETYIQGLFVKLTKMINGSNDTNENVWNELTSIVSEITQLEKNFPCDNIAESSEWNDFFKNILGYCLKTGEQPCALKILRLFINSIYRPKKQITEKYSHYFQMVISHSQFLNVILKKSQLKRELVELYYCLIEKCPSEMSAKHVPILLAAYGASMNETDVVILKILQLYENNGVQFGDYEPLIWGETAVSHYGIGTGNKLSLWQRFNMLNVLNLLDSQKMEISLVEFPIYRTLQHNSVKKKNFDPEAYDPAFLLPLFSNLLSPGSVVFLLPFVYKGGLAYTVRALSSECYDIRRIASLVLTRFYNHLELSQNFKQKLVWMHFVNCIRFGIEDLSVEPVPNIISLFVSRMTLELSGPPSDMQLPLQNFLLAKPYFSFKAIPEFLPLFHSSHVSFGKHRVWLLNILKDATKTDADTKIIFYSMALKVIFCSFHSPFCDQEMKKLTLQVIERLVIAKNSELLFSEYGLLSWINSIELNSNIVSSEEFLKLLEGSYNVLCKNSKQIGENTVTYVIQILNILLRVLPHLNAAKSIVAFGTFIKLFLSCLLFVLKSKKREWFQLNKNKVKDIIDSGILHLGTDVAKFGSVSFYFREHDNAVKDDILDQLKKVVFIYNLLIRSEA